MNLNMSLVWRKSRRSGANDNCVEVAVLQGGGRAVRDSKDAKGPVLSVESAGWGAFIGGVKAGRFGGSF